MRADAPELTDHWWWRPRWQVGTRYYSWHVLLDGQPELRAYAARYQEALRPFGALDLVPDRNWDRHAGDRRGAALGH